MKIGIDISQLAYPATGVANFVYHLIENLLKNDSENEYILFYSSLRRPLPATALWSKNKSGQTVIHSDKVAAKKVAISEFKFPPTLLDLLWNRLHIVPIENFLGDIDVFISSDWTQPPVKKAKRVTILYDLIVYKYPSETAKKIVAVQRRRLFWVKKEVDKIICISKATRNDAIEILGVAKDKLSVIYPGV